MNVYLLMADAVAAVHFAFVGFVVFGMLLILLGIARGWQWVRNFWFRAIHFLMIGVVVAESLGGVVCPLTDWEYQLRVMGGQQGRPGSFIGYWVHRLMFFDAPQWAFTTCYCLFGLAVFLTLVLAPPRRPWAKGQ